MRKNPTLRKICECFFSGVIIAVLLLLVLWFINFFKVFPLPDFLKNFFDSNKESPDSSYYDESRFYEFLENSGEGVSTVEYVSLNKDNVVHLIKKLIVQEGYYWEVETEVFYGASSSLSVHKIWNNGSSMRVDTVSNGINTSLAVTDKGTAFRDNLNGKTRIIEGDTDYAPESIINIADIAFYVNSERTQITDARFVETDSEEYLYISFYTEEFDKTDEFYLSLDYGIVLSASSEMEGVQTFSQKTKDFVLDSTMSEELFSITE